MNVVDWMRATAEWMHADKPDEWPAPSDALDTLGEWMEKIRTDDTFVQGLETGGYLLSHTADDGVEEWMFHKIISSCAVFEEEDEHLVLGWTKNSGTLKVGIELPDVLDIDL